MPGIGTSADPTSRMSAERSSVELCYSQAPLRPPSNVARFERVLEREHIPTQCGQLTVESPLQLGVSAESEVGPRSTSGATNPLAQIEVDVSGDR